MIGRRARAALGWHWPKWPWTWPIRIEVDCTNRNAETNGDLEQLVSTDALGHRMRQPELEQVVARHSPRPALIRGKQPQGRRHDLMLIHEEWMAEHDTHQMIAGVSTYVLPTQSQYTPIKQGWGHGVLSTIELKQPALLNPQARRNEYTDQVQKAHVYRPFLYYSY